MYKYVCKNNEASRGARAQSVTVNATGCGFDPHSKCNIYLKFIFPCRRSGFNAKRGVKFHHTTHNAPRFRRKVRNGMS